MDIDSEKVGIYNAIYGQLYENHFVSLSEIAENTNMPFTAVSFLTGEHVLATLRFAGNFFSDVFKMIAHLKKLYCFTEVYRCIYLFRG